MNERLLRCHVFVMKPCLEFSILILYQCVCVCVPASLEDLPLFTNLKKTLPVSNSNKRKLAFLTKLHPTELTLKL